MQRAASIGKNDLLAALPRRERDRVMLYCERVTLARDEILGAPGERIRYVYFPIDSVISLLVDADQHDPLGVCFIGSEGLLGASLALGDTTSSLRARVQGRGSALRIKVADFYRAIVESPELERQLRLDLNLRFSQIAKTVACTAFHALDLRLAYWLLIAHDRAHGSQFYLTHEVLAHMLGVRRSGVTTAAGVLQRRELIIYTRGQVTVMDREGLERAACSCYRATHTFGQSALKSERRDHSEIMRDQPELA